MNYDGLNSLVNGRVLLVELFAGDCTNAHIHGLRPSGVVYARPERGKVDMASGRKYFCIQLKCRAKVLEKKLCELQLSDPVAQALNEFEQPTESSKVKLFTAEKENAVKTEVSLDTPLVVIDDFGHRYLEFYLQEESQEASTSGSQINPDFLGRKTNALTVLMASQAAIHLPPKKPDTKANCRLFNNFLDVLKDSGIGFRPNELEIGKTVCETLANALWYIQANQQNFEERSIHLPALFTASKFRDVVDHKASHKPRPRVSYFSLHSLFIQLSNIYMRQF